MYLSYFSMKVNKQPEIISMSCHAHLLWLSEPNLNSLQSFKIYYILLYFSMKVNKQPEISSIIYTSSQVS